MLASAPSPLFTVIRDICKLIADGVLNLGKAEKHKKFAQKVSKGPASALKGQNGGAIGSIIAGVLPFLIPLFKKLFK